MRLRPLMLLGLVTAARAQWLFTGVSATRLLELDGLSRHMTFIADEPCMRQAIVGLTAPRESPGALGVYPTVATAQEVLDAFGGWPVDLRWRGTGEPDSARCRLLRRCSDVEYCLRWRNFVWVARGSGTADTFTPFARKIRARLDDPRVASRGEQVPAPTVTARAPLDGPVQAGDIAAWWSASPANEHLLSPAWVSCSVSRPDTTTVHGEGSELDWYGAIQVSRAPDRPGPAVIDAWFATPRNVIVHARQTVTVWPRPDGPNDWLEEWPVDGPQAGTQLLDAPALAELAAADRLFRPAWRPPRGLCRSSGEAPAHRTRCTYRGSSVRVSWMARGVNDHLVYVEQDWPTRGRRAVAARDIFQPDVQVTTRTPDRPLAPGAAGPVLVYVVEWHGAPPPLRVSFCAPRRWPWREAGGGLLLVGLAYVWRRRARRRQRF